MSQNKPMSLKNPKLLLLTVLWLFATLLTSGCAKSDCMVADTVTPVHESEAATKGYTLAITTTGMQDKVVAVSLFKSDVKFDDCGKPSSAAYDEVVVENGKKVSKIVIQDNRVTLNYSSETGHFDFQTVPVEFK